MKKRNFITGFSAAFVAAIALVSCGGIKSKEGVVLIVNGVEYKAKDLFEDQKTPASAEAKFNAVYKAAIRTYFAKGDGTRYNDEITRDTKLKIAGAKEEAKTNADKNGTKYKTEWEKILSNNGVDDEQGLYDKFEYELQKTKFDDVFYEISWKEGEGESAVRKTNYDILRDGGWFKDSKGVAHGRTDEETGEEAKIKGYLEEKQPYHMKHILVKIANGKQDGDDLDCTISRDEAWKLYRIVFELANGSDFEDVCLRYSDKDDSAKTNHGSLGIMSRDTSFVNDFKLGVYLYDAFYGHSASDSNTTYEGKSPLKLLFGDNFDLENPTKGTAGWFAKQIVTNQNLKDPTNKDTLTATDNKYTGIGQIPYGEILKFRDDTDVIEGESAKGIGNVDQKNKNALTRFTNNGVDLTKVKDKYLPRNVIFNKYFNKHNIMVITPNKLNTITGTTGSYIKQTSSDTIVRSASGVDQFESTLDETITEEKHIGYNTLPGFTRDAKNGDAVSINSNNNQVLRDENGRTILVFRSGSGSSKTSNDGSSGYQGIHFIVLERSPFIGKEYESGDPTKEENKNFTTLDEYYTQYYPGQTNGYHPVYDDTLPKENQVYKKTYTHFIEDEQKLEVLKSRSDTVKTELKKADDNLNTYIYDYLIAKGNIKFTSTAEKLGIPTSIDNWINYTKRGDSKFNKEKTWNETWAKYYNNLEARYEVRKKKEEEVEPLIPEICAIAFEADNVSSVITCEPYEQGGTRTVTLYDLFKEGGAFNA